MGERVLLNRARIAIAISSSARQKSHGLLWLLALREILTRLGWVWLQPYKMPGWTCYLSNGNGRFIWESMGFDREWWSARIASRSEITSIVTHLTKPGCNTNGLSEDEINQLATENLIKILQDSVIYGSTTEKGFIVGKIPAVCFWDTPLYGLIQNVEHESQRRKANPKERYRYCGVGLAFPKLYVFSKGVRPVLYEQTEVAKKILPESDYWRIVNFNISGDNTNFVDWTHEREWRLPNKSESERNLAYVLLYNKSCWN